MKYDLEEFEKCGCARKPHITSSACLLSTIYSVKLMARELLHE